jgi:two-component system, NarL family, nitrate/nitrite response regulator NarL
MIHLLLVDPLELVRRSLRAALERESDITVVAEASNVAEAVTQLERSEPDVTVLASTELECRADEAVRSLRAADPDCKIVLIVGPSAVPDLLGAVEAGIRACLTHSATVPQLAGAIRTAHEGGTMIDSDALASLFDQVARSGTQVSEARARIQRLTLQERRVLALLAQGVRNEEIAARLNISPHTLRTHVQRVLAKLSVHSRLEAVAYVNRHDLLAELEAKS